MKMSTTIAKTGRAILNKMAEKSPWICATAGCIGIVVSGVIMKHCVKKEDDVREAYIEKTLNDILKRNPDKEPGDIDFSEEDFTRKDKVKVHLATYWKAYLAMVLSITLVIGGQYAVNKRIAKMALASTAISSVQDVLVDKGAERLKTAIKGEDAEKYIPKVVSGTGIERGNGGIDIFYSSWSGRFFFSDINTVKAAYANANDSLSRADEGVGRVSINDICDDLGIAKTEVGETNGFIPGDHLDMSFEMCTFEDGKPYTKIIYEVAPKELF